MDTVNQALIEVAAELTFTRDYRVEPDQVRKEAMTDKSIARRVVESAKRIKKERPLFNPSQVNQFCDAGGGGEKV